MKSLSRAEVRAVDRWASEHLAIPSIILMENAGRGAVDVIERTIAPAGKLKVAIVTGGGNNAGDGFAMARHLSLRGADVVTHLAVADSKIAGDAACNLRIIQNMHLKIIPASDINLLEKTLQNVDLVVDALGGTGITGELRENIASVVKTINASGVDVFAVDIPTGLDCDLGIATSEAIRAKVTATFVARKLGFDLVSSQKYTGLVEVVDIGINISGFLSHA